jgi:hypothetical protein
MCVHIRTAEDCRLHLSSRGGEARDSFVLLLVLLLASHCIALHCMFGCWSRWRSKNNRSRNNKEKIELIENNTKKS